jgi:hypothetical protein
MQLGLVSFSFSHIADTSVLKIEHYDLGRVKGHEQEDEEEEN